MTSLRSRHHRAAMVVLLAMLVLAFALEGSQPAHSHEDGRLGLYNADCPLAELTAVHGDGLATAPLTIASPAPVALPVAATAFGWVPSPLLSLADSRAPPLA